ncbi:MAG: GIY-YIG nuclease family protein [Thermodesulfobacteriota bacterium]
MSTARRVDGTPTGVLTAEIINWTGKVLVAPRSQLGDLTSRQEVARTGVYLLVGPDPEDPFKERVYIGETEGVFKRLLQHARDSNKDFWTKAVIIVSKDENLTKSHVRYLESRLISLARGAGRANLTNDTQPEPASLPESDKADMEFFIDQVQMILPVLGFSLTQPRPAVSAQTESEADAGAFPFFVLEQVGVKARAREVNGEFVLLAGSTARKHGVASWTSYKSLRHQLVEAGKLVDGAQPDQLVVVEDISFGSPSAAGAVVLGRNVNGRLDWKVEGSGETYEEWSERRLPAGSSIAPIEDGVTI